MSNFEARYETFDNGYKQIVHASTRSRCCWCLVAPSTCVHHAAYGKGDIPGVHCFALCDRCHSKQPGCVHHPLNWLKDKRDPTMNNRNTDEALMRLQFGYDILSGSKKICS